MRSSCERCVSSRVRRDLRGGHSQCVRVCVQEEELAKENPDFNRAIRVNEYSKKTGIVRDKRGNIIGACYSTACSPSMLEVVSVSPASTHPHCVCRHPVTRRRDS